VSICCATRRPLRMLTWVWRRSPPDGWGAGIGGCAGFSDPADHHRGALSAGGDRRWWRASWRSACGGRSASRSSSRNVAGGIGQHRGRPGRARGRRRHHAQPRQFRLACPQRGALCVALRPAQRFRAGRAAHQAIRDHHHPHGRAGRESDRADRMAQTKPRQGDGGKRRRRRVGERRLFPEQHRDAVCGRALPRRRRRRCRT